MGVGRDAGRRADVPLVSSTMISYSSFSSTGGSSPRSCLGRLPSSASGSWSSSLAHEPWADSSPSCAAATPLLVDDGKALHGRSSSPRVLVPLVDTLCKRLVLGAITAYSLVAFGCIWAWWLSLHLVDGGSWGFLSVICTAMLARETCDLLLQYGLLFRAKSINQAVPPPRFRVAMIATKVPSEPLSMLQATLTAMLNQDYPYPFDVWLADEHPDRATQEWCAEHGIRISCRFGVPQYHRPAWPRRTRCKEGNLSFFYDNWGYEMYEIVAQFDADHVPDPNYLSSCLPAFLDPQVGYVACPSICDANVAASWSARGRLYFESYFHGPLGPSLALSYMPCCIGSHYVVRTAHLQAAGGLGPELDEDMTTSFIMTANGFKGVFGLDTIAHGDGPACFEDCMHQEYQWARSAMVVLTSHLWPWFGRDYSLSACERLRVLHWLSVWLVQSAYIVAYPFNPLVALGLGTGYLQPVPGLTWRHFIMAVLAATCGHVAHWLAARRFGWLRPRNPPVVSYERELYGATRNFYICMGTVHGLLGGLLGIDFDFRVTPKGAGNAPLITVRCLAPLLAYSAAGFGGSYLVPDGLPYLAMMALGAAYMTNAVLIIVLHYAENHGLPLLPLPRARARARAAWAGLPHDNLFSLLVPLVLLAALASHSISLRAM